MTIANGIFKQLRYGVETTWGTKPAAGSGFLLRRVISDLSLNKDSYGSNEIISSQQIRDFRHGVRRAEGRLQGELSPKTYADFMAAILRRDFTAGATTGPISTVTAAAAGKTFTRSAGSYLTDGFKVGDVVRWTGFAQTANNNTNYRIVNLTGTIMTVAETVTDEAAGASVTGTVVGKKTWVPSASHTDKSFTIEHWFDDVNQSEVFVGCKVGQMDIALPATGISQCGFAILGKDMESDTSEYFTTPADPTTTGVTAAVNGKLRIAGADVAVVTGASFTVGGSLTSEPVVGSNTYPDIFRGRVIVQGQMTAFFEDGTLRDAFLNETEISLHLFFTTSNAANADFINFTFPRIKLGGSAKDDGEKGIIQNIPFFALENTATTNMDLSTIVIQDSQA